MKYQEIEGDLIKLAQLGTFDVIVHGCNCFCTMGAGIAPQMAKAFGCDYFDLEGSQYYGEINKLGQIDYQYDNGSSGPAKQGLIVVNAYTQYGFGANHKEGIAQPLDYEALALCMRKINKIFAGRHIGLPQIGCGLAGGDWNIVKAIIKKELKDCDITIVIYERQ